MRRKEFERNTKREFGKALALLTAYALVPCVSTSKDSLDSNTEKEKKGVRLIVSNQLDGGYVPSISSLFRI